MVNQFREQMPRPIVGIGHSIGGAQLFVLLFGRYDADDDYIQSVSLYLTPQSSNIFDLDGAHDAKGPSSRPERCPALYFT